MIKKINRNGIDIVNTVIFDGEHLDSVACPALAVEFSVEQIAGVINIDFPHKPSGWISVTLADGEVSVSIYKKPVDGKPTWSFSLDAKNEFVQDAIS